MLSKIEKAIFHKLESKAEILSNLFSFDTGVRVVFDNSVTSACADIKSKTLYLPELNSDNLPEESLNVIRRWILHESYHIKLTPENIFEDVREFIELKDKENFHPALSDIVANLVEDIRIDSFLFEELPGSYRASIEAFKYYLKEHIKRASSGSNLSKVIQLCHVISYTSRGLINHLPVKDLYDEDVLNFVLTDKTIERLLVDIDKLVKLKDISKDYFEVCFDTYSLCLKFILENSDQPEKTKSSNKQENEDYEEVEGGYGEDTDFETSKDDNLSVYMRKLSIDKHLEDYLEFDETTILRNNLLTIKTDSCREVDREDKKIRFMYSENVCNDKESLGKLFKLSLPKKDLLSLHTFVEETNKRFSGKMRRSLRLLEGLEKSEVVRGKKKGLLDSKSLYKVSYLDNKIFKRKEFSLRKNVGVTLLVDSSSSVSTFYKDICSSVYLTGFALDKLNIPFEIILYTSFDNTLYIENTVLNSLDKYSLYVFGEVFLYRAKSFEDKFKKSFRDDLEIIGNFLINGNSTPSSAALSFAARSLYRLNNLDRRVIFHITDGLPNDCVVNGSPEESFVLTRDLIELDKKFLILGVGVGSEIEKNLNTLYKDFIYVQDYGKLSEDLFFCLTDTLKRFYA